MTNTIGSSITREADGILYQHAGPEIGVAATKTFATQMVALHLLALYLAQTRGTMFPEEVAETIARMHELPAQVEQAILLDAQVRELAERFAGARDFLFIGRHTGYPAALEGALKLKEISYIHAEGYPAGELKHGPIALVEDGVPVVVVATECHVYPKVLSNIQEVRARGAEVIAVATEGDEQILSLADHVLYVPQTPELLSPVVVTVEGKPAFEMLPIRSEDPDFVDPLLEQNEAFRQLLEEQRQEGAGEQQDDEGVEGDLAEQERPVVGEDLPQEPPHRPRHAEPVVEEPAGAFE